MNVKLWNLKAKTYMSIKNVCMTSLVNNDDIVLFVKTKECPIFGVRKKYSRKKYEIEFIHND
jgi:hypothetical protein